MRGGNPGLLLLIIAIVVCIVLLPLLLLGAIPMGISSALQQGAGYKSATATAEAIEAATAPPFRNVNTLNTGTWKGQGTYNSGKPPFGITMTVNSVTGNTFKGTQQLDDGTIVNINGTIIGNTFSYTNTDYLFSTVEVLSCTYKGTVSGGLITNGTWVCPDHQTGSFSLKFETDKLDRFPSN